MSDDDAAKHTPQPPLTSEDLKRVPDDIRVKIERFRFEHSVEMIHSPLLPPAILKEYDTAVPGLARMLVEWTEAETAHRQRLERDAFDETRKLRGRAQLFGGAVSLAGIVMAGIVGVHAAQNGSFAGALVASAIAIVSVGGPLAARILAGRWRSGTPDDDDN